MARFQLYCVCTVLFSVILHSASNCTTASDDSIHPRHLKLTLFMWSSQNHHLHHGARSRSWHNPHAAQGMCAAQWQNHPERTSSPSQSSFWMILGLGCLCWSYHLPVPSQSISLCLNICMSKILLRIHSTAASWITCVQQRHGNQHTEKMIRSFCIQPT